MDRRRPDQKPDESTAGDSMAPLGLALMLAWLALIVLALITFR